MEPMHWQPACSKEKGHQYAHNRSSTHTNKFADNAHSSIAVSDEKCWCWQCTNTAWFYYWHAASDGENVVELFEQKKCFQISGNQLEVMRLCYKELTKDNTHKVKDVAVMATAELRSELAIASKLLTRENFLGKEESELSEILAYAEIDYEDDVDLKSDIHRISDAKFAKKVCLHTPHTPYSFAPLIIIRSLACCRQLLL